MSTNLASETGTTRRPQSLSGPFFDITEVSVVIPRLNEADTVGTCIAKAQPALGQSGIQGEVIVADNGSTDGSRDIVKNLGALLVPVAMRGYGAALMGGIGAAHGQYVRRSSPRRRLSQAHGRYR